MGLSRKILFWLHLVAGCVTAIAVFAMCLSGAVLAFERQLTNWAEVPKVTVPQPAPAAMAPLEDALKAVDGRGTGAPSQLTIYKDREKPLAAVWGRQTTVYIDPYAGQALPEAQTHRMKDFLAVMMKVHRALGAEMRNATARGLADAANLIFLFIVVSGLYLWLPKVWSATQVKMRLWFRGGLRGKALEWNWHHVIGIWTLIPLFFVVLTGVIISYGWASNLLYTMTGSPVPVRRGPPGPGGPGGPGGPEGGREGKPNGAPAGEQKAAKSTAPATAAPAASKPAAPAAENKGGDPAAQAHNGRGGEGHGPANGEGHGGRDGMEGRGPGGDEQAHNGRGGEGHGPANGEGHGPGAAGEHGAGRGEKPQAPDQPAVAHSSKPAGDKPATAAKKPEQKPAQAEAPAAAEPAAKTLYELADVAAKQVPEWKSISIQAPSAAGRTVSLSVDKSIGGQPEKVVTLTLDRQSGELKSTKTFADNSLGQRLRTYARMVHTGEEFGIPGAIIGSLICIGGLFLVWTGVALTVRRALAALKRSKAASQA